MADYTITPTVDETREFLEIANDFANPLDLVREAISNAFDAGASDIAILFDTVEEYGEAALRIRIHDNGHGMNEEELQSFFDLGNSLNRDREGTIGEKGHGTKVYFNSSRVTVETWRDGQLLSATLEQPFKSLHDGDMPTVRVTKDEADAGSGTRITIVGYYNNRRRHFTHERLKDHIYWFTKFGSIEEQFERESLSESSLELQGLDRDEPETLEFGHPFPKESGSVDELLDEYELKAPGFYSRRWVEEGNLTNHPEIKYQAVFSVEGRNVKYSYNDMLRRRGYTPPEGAYTVRERYGLWLCKDFIPVQRKNIWLTERGRGFEFTRFHAFVNCQQLRLTANRGSVDNTPPEVLEDLKATVQDIHDGILEHEEWNQLEWLEEAVEADRTIEKERQEFRTRQDRANSSRVAEFEGHRLVEPQRESGLYGLLVQLLTIDADTFPFRIVSYDTHSGIDLLVKKEGAGPVGEADLYYVELKHNLSNQVFNHSFRNTYSIVCWACDVENDEIIEDIRGEKRRMVISREEGMEYTTYMLDWPKKDRKIEVYVLEHYLKEAFGVEFQERDG